MIELTRTVRFCLNDDGAGPGNRYNGYSAWPAMRGLGRYYEIDVLCRGEADPRTGYFINIKHMDAAVRDDLLPLLEKRITDPMGGSALPMGDLLREMVQTLQSPLNHTLNQLTLRLTPMVSLTMNTNAMDRVLLRQRYEFSAAHRLNVPELDADQNREIFGKCNNPAGHGHNYQVEVAVSYPIDEAGRVLRVEDLDAVVDEHAIQRLDHKHLNHDVPEFVEHNPSVEHIAQVIWHMLAEPVTTLGQGTHLVELSVWETQKTACTYRGPSDHANLE